ncbi:putative rhamnogalacturonate lyase C [Pseudocercospora fuligena]|uniref:Putative rhamnogalacturonate lyase C n=1 Tax=Pseudocercospora fuligena TaxID=685502 RepID=A0A8H6RHB7_9PEZI|nr:putative rhamnogalacturonate lyase C [Pseudocercospora fuligena]
MQKALLSRASPTVSFAWKDLTHNKPLAFDNSQIDKRLQNVLPSHSNILPHPLIPTSFLILSDTHNFVPDPSKSQYPLNNLLSQNQKFDVLLHCGDLTQVGGSASYKKCLNFLSKVNADLKLVIAGNHDLDLDPNIAEDEEEREDHLEAIELMTDTLAKEAGITYLTEGNHSFDLANGATLKIFVSPFTPKVGDWAFGYPREKGEEFWEGKIDKDVDFVMTHGPMKGELDFAHGGSQGCDGLRKEVERVRPLVHCFGHIHEGYGVKVKEWEDERGNDEVEGREVRFRKAGVGDEKQEEVVKLRKGKETLVVNAAIMDKGHPTNAPWLVEVPLRGQ